MTTAIATTAIAAVGALPAGATGVRALLPLSRLKVNSRRELKFRRNRRKIFLEALS
jgi:hypothetical protein